jgi:signal recognition particle subunit SRP19
MEHLSPRKFITAFNSSKKHSDPERWICIYPAYLDSTKTLRQGRKVPKNKGVKAPRILDMYNVLKTLNFPVCRENKQYSREYSNKECTEECTLFKHGEKCFGRIRVQLKNEDGTAFNPQLSTRNSILLYLGEKIPQIKPQQGSSKAQQRSSKKKRK